jgi:hypothetical protein
LNGADRKLWAVMDILKVARKLNALDGSNLSVCSVIHGEWWERNSFDDVYQLNKSTTKNVSKKAVDSVDLLTINCADIITALAHADAEMRLSALEFLCGSKTSRPLNCSELACLKTFISEGMKEEESKLCNAAPNHLKRLFCRLRDSSKSLRKYFTATPPPGSHKVLSTCALAYIW